MATGECERTIGGFRLVREIGRGAVATVYEATQLRLKRRVALKALHPAFSGEPQAVRRFLREAEAVGKLRHGNVVTVHDRGQGEAGPYLVMDLVDGPNLAELIERLRGETDGEDFAPGLPGPGTAAEDRIAFALEIGAAIADALHHAHEQGVVHRDVKPSNVLLDGRTPLVSDFGLADVAWGSRLTATGECLGTPAYMSPEQALGREADARSDVYALGATLYELITLRRSVEGGSLQDYFRRIPVEDPPSPRSLVPAVSTDLETVLAKAMRKDPGERYPSAAALAEDLRALARGDAVSARPEGAVRRIRRAAGRKPVRAVGVVASLVVTVAAALLVALWPDTRPGASLDLSVDGGTEASVWYVPLDEEGYPGHDTAFELGKTPLVGEWIPTGEGWLVLETEGRFHEVYVAARLDERVTRSSVRLRPDSEVLAGMVEVPAGSGEFHDVPGRRSWRRFHIDRYEVTCAQFHAFVRDSGYEPMGERPDWTRPPREDWRNRPATVTWYDALAYAEYHGKRLPTLVEWLAARRAGGEPPGSYAGTSPLPVGECPEDVTGLDIHDMAGNVSEWTMTWQPGRERPDGDRAPATCRYLAGRSCDPTLGAQWAPEDLAIPFEPDYRGSVTGFRCVRSHRPSSHHD